MSPNPHQEARNAVFVAKTNALTGRFDTDNSADVVCFFSCFLMSLDLLTLRLVLLLRCNHLRRKGFAMHRTARGTLVMAKK